MPLEPGSPEELLAFDKYVAESAETEDDRNLPDGWDEPWNFDHLEDK